MEEKPLRFIVLEYLKNHDATSVQIDIKTHFLNKLTTYEDKLKFQNCIEHLDHNGFIKTNGGYYNLTTTFEGKYKELDEVIIKAMITPDGEQYLRDNEDKNKSSYDLTNANNIIIAHSHSSVDNTILANKSPMSNPTVSDKAIHKTKSSSSIWTTIIAGVIVLVIGILITVLLRGCGVNAQNIIIHK